QASRASCAMIIDAGGAAARSPEARHFSHGAGSFSSIRLSCSQSNIRERLTPAVMRDWMSSTILKQYDC
ncbi:MAG: hypothetical protein WBE48_23230, partial [Xanthobacteraceae bacterium]